MKFSQFVDVFVAALYNETELTGRSEFSIADLLEKYGLELSPTWGERLFDDYTFSSRVDARRHIGPLYQQRVRLSADGLRWVEDELGENVAGFLERNGAVYGEAGATFDPNIFDSEVFDTDPTTLTPDHAQLPSFSSANWTGISERLGAAQKAHISDLSSSLIAAINQADVDDRTRKTVIKHVEAVQSLLQAPDPPWKAIVELLNHPAITAFLVAVQILQLIWGAAN